MLILTGCTEDLLCPFDSDPLVAFECDHEGILESFLFDGFEQAECFIQGLLAAGGIFV